MPKSESEWTTVEIRVHADLADPVSNILMELGSGGVVLEGPDEGPLFAVAYFRTADFDRVREELHRRTGELHAIFPNLPAPDVSTSPLKVENWAIAWRDHFTNIDIGRRLMVTPPWLDPDPHGREVIIIEPAEAFGTGTHETTQGCLTLLETAVDELPGEPGTASMLDVGCGSGILTVAAVKLGLGTALGLDNDPVAVEASRNNAELNQTGGRAEWRCGDLAEASGSYEIVTANLDPKTLKNEGHRLLSLFNESLIISGVPLNQWDEIKSLFLGFKLILKEEIRGTEWAAGRFAKSMS
jgi:ribosomal protein L11 methyltransferase